MCWVTLIKAVLEEKKLPMRTDFRFFSVMNKLFFAHNFFLILPTDIHVRMSGYGFIMYIYVYYNRKHRGGNMRATILPCPIILTKVHRAAVSMMAKGCIGARVLPLRCFSC